MFQPEGVNSVLDFLDRHADQKVLVHCLHGGRAAALVLLSEAKRRGWGASEAIEKGRSEANIGATKLLRAVSELSPALARRIMLRY